MARVRRRPGRTLTDAPLRLAASAAELADDFARVRHDLAVPTGFHADVIAEAARVARDGPQLPPGAAGARLDARDLDLVTVDPPGTRDLDQAFHAERTGTGYRVHYAIADVAAFVAPGGALDRDAFARGVTLYLPDGRAPLYPDDLGEGVASLLPGVDRPALLWTFELDAGANASATRCVRATVRSRAARSYAEVQRSLESGVALPSFALLREIGLHLLDRERERGGVSIAAPEQEVVKRGDGSYALEFEAPLPVEAWNAQISLLTGREAARDHGRRRRRHRAHAARAGARGRRPSPRATAVALGISWPRGASYADVVRGMLPTSRARATFLLQALHVLRGAGYELVTPGAPVPSHGAVGAPYAHVTAPLRRLADRHANEVVLAACAGVAPPEWAVAALPDLVTVMPRADQHASAVNRACVDAVEVVLLAGHEGETFRGTVVDRHRRGVVVMLADAAHRGDRARIGRARRRGDGQARGTGSGRPDGDVRACSLVEPLGRLDRARRAAGAGRRTRSSTGRTSPSPAPDRRARRSASARRAAPVTLATAHATNTAAPGEHRLRVAGPSPSEHEGERGEARGGAGGVAARERRPERVRDRVGGRADAVDQLLDLGAQQRLPYADRDQEHRQPSARPAHHLHHEHRRRRSRR